MAIGAIRAPTAHAAPPHAARSSGVTTARAMPQSAHTLTPRGAIAAHSIGASPNDRSKHTHSAAPAPQAGKKNLR